MHIRTTMVLLMAVAVVGAGLWLSDRSRRTERENVQLGSPLVIWQPNGVIGLEIESDGLHLVLTKQDDQWFLQAPLRARADSGQVERMLSVLEALTREEIVTPQQRDQRGLGLEDYGLAKPWARWTIVEEGRRQELEVGVDAPLGALTYVRFSKGRDVIATGQALRKLVPASVDVLRDARILNGSPERVTRVELHRAGRSFLRLARQDGQWMLKQPVTGRADAGLVDNLLDQLFALQASAFVWDGEAATSAPPAIASAPPAAAPGATTLATDPRLEQYGLAEDEANARVQLWMDGDLVAYELVIGKPTGAADGSVYATRRDVQSVYAILPTQLEWLVVNEDALRERDVFSLAPGAISTVRLREGERKLELARDAAGSWMMVDPWQGPADQQSVTELVQGLTGWRALAFVDGAETSVAQAALANPTCVIRLATDRPAALPVSAETEASPGNGDDVPLRVGVVTAGVPAVYVQFEGSPEICRLPMSALQALGNDPLDPLLYRDRMILSVPVGDVQRITLARGDGTQTVTRAGERWRAAGETNGVAQDAIEDALFFASNLRALRVEAMNPTNLAAYGLEPGVVAMTLGLTGDAGIQKTLVLGGSAGADSRYATVQGQDVVFTISAAMADLLARDLLAPR